MRGKMIFLALALIFLIPCATGAESAPSQLLELLQDSLIAPYEEALPLLERDCATAENDFLRLTMREALYDGIARIDAEREQCQRQIAAIDEQAAAAATAAAGFTCAV